ncbi:MAG: GYD domain-containing protein [Candidatus Rokubacteria bacterium]|nr:GYD domain-containing protein [Candidatus Rokubacteria bacterium]
MSLYIMLNTLTEEGRQVLRNRPGWIRKVNADVKRMGARVLAQYAVLGPYDFVTVIEAPDNATISRVSLELGARGGTAGMTLAAIPLDEFIARLERGRGRRSARARKKRGSAS